jgi:hypothetical protein
MIPLIRRLPAYSRPVAEKTNTLAELINKGLVVDSDTIRAQRLPDGRVQLVLAKPPTAAPATAPSFICPASITVTFADVIFDCGCTAGHYQYSDISFNGAHALSITPDSPSFCQWGGEAGSVRRRAWDTDGCGGAPDADSESPVFIEVKYVPGTNILSVGAGSADSVAFFFAAISAPSLPLTLNNDYTACDPTLNAGHGGTCTISTP